MGHCVKQLGSFPNTRQRPRKPTIDADTAQVLAKDALGVPDISSVADLVSDDKTDEGKLTTNGNTILRARNLDRTYLTLRNIDPSENIAYGYRDRANLATSGMILRAGDSVDIDSPKIIFVRSLALGGDVLTAYDEGIG